MAKTYHILIFSCLVIVGCETEKIIFSGPNHVRFTTTTRTEKESYSRLIRIEVHLAGPRSNEDINVTYSIAGDARENVDYVILGTRGRVVIGAGDYFGYIDLQLLNNANDIIRSQEIIFSLTGISDNAFEVAFGAGEIGKEFTFTIVDDCILGGLYTGKKSALETPVADILISSEDCKTYRLSNWNVNIVSDQFDYGLIFIDNGDNTITIPHQEENFDLHGVGTVDITNREIQITLTLEDPDNPEVFYITLKPE
jgi:hypothetical protein